MTPRFVLALSTLSMLLVAVEVGAQEAEGGNQKGVITLAEVKITGRIQKPIAAVDVNRIQPKLTLSELRQPFLSRIEQAIYGEPF